jgi:aconitate hydratase
MSEKTRQIDLAIARTHATPTTGAPKTFSMRVRTDTPVELDDYRNGGILQTVLRKLLKD